MQLEDTSGRLRIVVELLKASALKESVNVGDKLMTQMMYITEKARLAKCKHDVFISHVQRDSGDLCARLNDFMTNNGLKSWYDLEAENADQQGIIDGIINSKVFMIVLTTNYFERKWCLFEYCLAIVLGKPIFTVYEDDIRFGGDRLEAYKIPDQFKSILNYELVKIDRKNWRSFSSMCESRIRSAVKLLTTSLPDDVKNILHSSSILTKANEAEFLRNELSAGGWAFGIRLYSSKEDGYTAEAFHKKCDGKGPTLTVVKAGGGRYVFGGFVPISWKSLDETTWQEAAGGWLFDVSMGKTETIHFKPGESNVVLSRCRGPTIFIGEKVGFTMHLGEEQHALAGVFASNTLKGSQRLDLDFFEEYEVFQIIALVM